MGRSVPTRDKHREWDYLKGRRIPGAQDRGCNTISHMHVLSTLTRVTTLAATLGGGQSQFQGRSCNTTRSKLYRVWSLPHPPITHIDEVAP